MLKLYRMDRRRFLYWQASETGREITIRSGVVGTFGEIRTVTAVPGESLSRLIWRESAPLRVQGFATMSVQEHERIVVRVPLDPLDEAPATDALRDSGWEAISDALESRGLGHCAAVTQRSGELVFCVYVLDLALARAVVLEAVAAAAPSPRLPVLESVPR